MNPFVAVLVLLIVAAWLATGVALVVGPGLYMVSDWRGDRAFDLVSWTMALGGVALGLGLLVLFGAVVSGGIGLSASHPDGCYFIHTELIGKVLSQQWEPISCP